MAGQGDSSEFGRQCGALVLRARWKQLAQRVDDGTLAQMQLEARLVEAEPGRTVDLRNGESLAGARWPVDLDGVGHQCGRIELAFQRERRDALGRLPEL